MINSCLLHGYSLSLFALLIYYSCLLCLYDPNRLPKLRMLWFSGREKVSHKFLELLEKQGIIVQHPKIIGPLQFMCHSSNHTSLGSLDAGLIVTQYRAGRMDWHVNIKAQDMFGYTPNDLADMISRGMDPLIWQVDCFSSSFFFLFRLYIALLYNMLCPLIS